MTNKNWDAALYEGKHAFVWEYGASLLELLSPKPGERILDLGCGTGQLTEKIAAKGAYAIGIDLAPSMIEKAKANYPQIEFAVADAKNFQFAKPFDAVFSNAALHWITEPDAVISCVRDALKPGGRFVAEFGGKGNIKAIYSAISSVLEECGYANGEQINPWYFPSIGEYTTRLEQQGFDVTYAVLFDRPTPLEDGDAGMKNWIEMFASQLISGLSVEQKSMVLGEIDRRLKPILYREGTWIADYRRIRVVAIKE